MKTTSKTYTTHLSRILPALALLALSALPASAQIGSTTWSGNTSTDFYDGSNWTNGQYPNGNTTFVDSALTGAANTTVDRTSDTAKYIFGLYFNNTLGTENSYTINGSTRFDIGGSVIRTAEVTSGSLTDVINADIADTGQADVWDIGANHHLDMNGVYSEGNTTTKTGAGILTFAGANTYTGATTITAGTLNVTNSSLTPSYTIASGAILNLSGADPAAGNTTFYGGGRLNFNDAAFFNANSGDFAMDSGALIDVKSGQLGFNGGNDQWTGNLADLNVEAAGSIRGAGNNIEINSLTGSGTFNMSGGIIKLGQDNGTGATFSGNFGISYGTGDSTGTASRIEKNGTGTQTLTGTLNLGSAGSVTVNDGTLILASSSNHGYGGAATINGGTLELQSTSGFRGYTGGDININNGSTLRFSVNGGNGYVLDAADTINFDSNGGGLMDVASGNFVVRGSTITTAGGAENTINGSFNMDSGGPATFDVASGTDAVDLTVNALLGNTQGITKQGAGTMELTANNTYTGLTTVSGGTLIINGDHTAATGGINVTGNVTGTGTLAGSGSIGGTATIGLGGILSPGNSPGTQTFDNLVWENGGTYLWEINADSLNGGSGTQGADPGWDWISVTNDWDISGITTGFNIDITSLTGANDAGLADGFDYSGKSYLDPFETFTILSFGTFDDTFDASLFSLNDSASFLNPKVGWSLEISGNDLVLNAVFVPEPSSTALLGLGGLALMLRRKRSAA